MTVTQRLMTHFFKPKKKRLITDYFKSASAAQVKIEKLHFYQHSTDYKQSRNYLKKNKHLYDASVTRNGYCYCSFGNFSEYTVFTTQNRVMHINDHNVFIPSGTFVAQVTIDPIFPQFSRHDV